MQEQLGQYAPFANLGAVAVLCIVAWRLLVFMLRRGAALDAIPKLVEEQQEIRIVMAGLLEHERLRYMRREARERLGRLGEATPEEWTDEVTKPHELTRRSAPYGVARTSPGYRAPTKGEGGSP